MQLYICLYIHTHLFMYMYIQIHYTHKSASSQSMDILYHDQNRLLQIFIHVVEERNRIKLRKR